MIAWRASPPARLPVVDLSVPPRRCRLVGRVGERVVFVFGSVIAICLRARSVASSRWRGSYPWRLASMSCPSCLRFAHYHYSSRPASRLSSRMASRCACLGSRCVFLVYFRIVPRWGCDCLICPRAPSRLSSRRSVSSCVSDGGIIVMCLLDLFPMAFSSRPCRFVGRDGERGETR